MGFKKDLFQYFNATEHRSIDHRVTRQLRLPSEILQLHGVSVPQGH